MNSADPTDLPEQQRRRQRKEVLAKLADDTEKEDWKWLMKSRRGRRIVWRLLEDAGAFRSSFNTNAMAMAFAEGNRNTGLRIFVQIQKYSPDLYTTMVKEANDRRNSDDADRNDH